MEAACHLRYRSVRFPTDRFRTAVVVTARCTLSLDLAKGNFVLFFLLKGIEYTWIGYFRVDFQLISRTLLP